MEEKRNEKRRTKNEQKKGKRIEMLLVTFLIALGIAAASQNASVTLPSGVKSVSFGQAQRYDAAGKELCAIVQPLPSPVRFERGMTEISYAVELEPRIVKSASARVVAPAGQELRAAGCNAFTPIKGGFSQTQLGSTISRIDKMPLVSGAYRLRITVDGQTAEIPFSIR
jgi:hypothetical protein